MTRRSARRFSQRILAVLLLAASASWPPLPLAGQEGAKRDAWQRPAEVMDALEVKAGSVVADVGTGEGYFAFHLAARVGPQGKVYAEDIDKGKLGSIRKRAKRENLSQIETVRGTDTDPRLPEGIVDAILVVNAYHEMREYDAMLQGMYRALKPGGLLGVIEAIDTPGKPRTTYQDRHTLPEETLREDAARNGFRFLRSLPGFHGGKRDKDYYFLIFQKPS